MRQLKGLFSSYFCYNKKFLIYNLVSKNLKVKYRRSYLGFFWTALTPISMALMYYFVFQVVLQLQMPQYLVFILVGILPWSFLNLTVLEGMEGVVGNVALLSKVPVPIQVFAFSGAVTNLINLFLSMPIFILASLWTGVALGWPALFLAYYFLVLFLFV